MMKTTRAFLVLLALASAHLAAAATPYQTENVVIAVMDGTSWQRTFGDPSHHLIPRLWKEVRPQGTLYTHFFNNGVTITKAGHSTMVTGTWQKMRNRGARNTMPTIFDYMADEQGLTSEKAWVIFGKGGYAFEPSTSFPAYQNRFVAKLAIDIGESTLQHDSEVLSKVLESMQRDKPRLVFANFGATDHMAHSGNWDWHVKAVEHQDQLLSDLWRWIETDPHYKGHTTLILTNDHGYHLDGIHEGFAEHGDSCEGCRHIMLLIVGPDTKKGATIERAAYQTDLAPTVGELLGFQTPLASGEVLREAFVQCAGRNRKEAVTETAKQAVRLNTLASGDLVRYLADLGLEREAKRPAPLAPDAGSALFYWGLLSAFDKTGDQRYLAATRAWGERQLAATGDQAVHAGLVLAELSYRDPDPRSREGELRAATRMAVDASRNLSPVTDWSRPEPALRAILIAAAAEIGHDRQLWQKAHEFLVGSLRARDLELARATALDLRPVDLKTGEDFVPTAGKLVPTQAATGDHPNDPWAFLALANVRSHGLGFKGEYFSDVPDLRAEVALQSYLAAKGLPGNGDLWPDTSRAAIQIAAVREILQRKDPYSELDKITEFDLVALRPDSPQILPPLDEVKAGLRKISAVNYNTEYGFAPYRDFDYTADLFRLFAQDPHNELETGIFLLALDSRRRISYEPDYPSPRD
jgi:Metalloenzyme superfamily